MTQFWFDQQRQLAIYPRSDQIARYIPDARPLSAFGGRDGLVAVPHTLQNAQTLRWLNYPVAPVMQDYDWPAAPGVKPWESQRLAANFMVLHPRCFNLSDMGSGKTMSALWASDWLMKQHEKTKKLCRYCSGGGFTGLPNNACSDCMNTGYEQPADEFRALIICPLSIMERKWANDIFKNFLGRRTFQILHGSAQARLNALAKPADYYIINFEGLGIGAHTRKKFELDGFSKALAERDDVKIAIVDEASAYKDSSTKRHRIAREVIGKRPYLFLMTGTPTPNAPTDAFGLAKLVNNAFGKSKTTFQMETMVKVSNFVWKPMRDGYDKARKILTPSIRIDIKDVWDAPELTTRQREVQLTVDQKKMMADLKRSLQIVVKSGHPINAANESAARLKFIQISLGAIYDANHKAHAIDASPRINELREVIEQAPGKILIFVPLTSVVNLLYRELKQWPRAVVNGDVSPKERSKIFQAFQEDKDPRIIIADPGTMSHGLDLWAAQTVIWYGTTEKTELYLQANKRAHRPGQKFPVTIVQLVSNQLEREIFRRLENNESLQGALLDIVRRGEL